MATVQERVAALPSLDVAARAAGLQQLLVEITAAPLECVRQLDVLKAVDAAIESTLPVFVEKTRHSAFPLAPAADSIYSSVQALLGEAASAYKSVILGLRDEPSTASGGERMHSAILRCVYYMGQQALHAYAVYCPAPRIIWKDLHRLYAWSEQQSFESGAVQSADTSIRAAYSRILLLALADPDHLMQGEIYQTYALLSQWAPAVRLIRSDDPISNRFFCDIAGDAPPGFGIDGINGSAVDPLLVDLDDVLGLINSRMKLLALNHQRSLQLRTEWDLLLRLRSAWEKRPLRNEVRHVERGISVKIVAGLSSCHYFFAGAAPFEPEQDESAIHGSGVAEQATLSLVPAEETPWLESDTQNKLKSGLLKPRAYVFDVDNRENDVWKKANRAGQRVDTELEKNLEERLLGKIFTFQLVNSSRGGIGLQAPADSPVRLRVGEVVAAFPPGDEEGGDPVLSVVRWIRSAADRSLMVGLAYIDGDVAPVAVRSLRQEAHFQSYARGFMIGDARGARSLVVPAALFNYGDRLLVNHGDRLEAVRLHNVLRSTRAISQFSCKAADDVSADYITSSLKKILRDSKG